MSPELTSVQTVLTATARELRFSVSDVDPYMMRRCIRLRAPVCNYATNVGPENVHVPVGPAKRDDILGTLPSPCWATSSHPNAAHGSIKSRPEQQPEQYGGGAAARLTRLA